MVGGVECVRYLGMALLRDLWHSLIVAPLVCRWVSCLSGRDLGAGHILSRFLSNHECDSQGRKCDAYGSPLQLRYRIDLNIITGPIALHDRNGCI